jgi:hypothetical protein
LLFARSSLPMIALYPFPPSWRTALIQSSTLF